MPTEHPRRAVLRALGAVAVGAGAGCIGTRSPTAGATPTPRSRPSDRSSTQTATGLPDSTVALPDGPKEPPGRPDALTDESAGAYVETFEYRYVYNQLWDGPSTVVHLECTTAQVADVGVGYRVAVDCTGWAESDAAHYDYFTQRSVYHLDADSLVRRHEGVVTPTSASSRRDR